jgi:5'-nucleotidase
MRLLLTNDDGIEASGIKLLARRLSAVHNVTVVAPESNRSGVSHSITWLTPVRIRERSMIEGVASFCTSGTPADCVVAATSMFKDDGFDLVISGINHGQNLGVDLRYSGTISAALEASTLDLPAVAVSIACEDEPDFSVAIDFVMDFIVDYDWAKLPKHTILNVNIPNLPKHSIKGVVCTRPGGLVKKRRFEKSVNEWGEEVFWMRKAIVHDSISEDFDFRNVFDGYISVSPINFFQHCDEDYKLSLEDYLSHFGKTWLEES